MRASYRAAADIERGTDELLHAKRLCADSGANDIHDRVGRADFVEVDIFDADIVNLGFRHAQCA